MTASRTAFLTLPAPAETTLVALKRKVRLLALRRLLTQPAGDLPPPMAHGLASLQAVLLGLLETGPDAVLDEVGNPDVLTPLLILAGGARPPEACLREAVPPLLAGLSALGPAALQKTIRWEVPLDRLVDARGGRALLFHPAARGLVAGPDGLDVNLASGTRLHTPPRPGIPQPGEGVTSLRPFHPLSVDHPRLHLSEIDTNPLAMLEEHPEKSGNAVDLGGRVPEEWTDALGKALELIRLGLPSWYAELTLALERVVPVGYDAERHLSASYREAPGLAYLSLHPEPLTMAEAIVHETQHGKLNLLSWLDPVLRNGHSCFTESPVRPDPRPLMGVLLALHAFVPVAALHRALAEARHPVAATERFARRRAEVIVANGRSLAALRDLAEPTANGRLVLEGLAQLHAELLEADQPPIESSTVPP